MDIVERLRSLKSDEYIENLVGKAADEIERLREQVEFERASLQAAFGELRKLDGDIERLREALQEIAAPSKVIAKNEDAVVTLQLLLSSHRKTALKALGDK